MWAGKEQCRKRHDDTVVKGFPTPGKAIFLWSWVWCVPGKASGMRYPSVSWTNGAKFTLNLSITFAYITLDQCLIPISDFMFITMQKHRLSCCSTQLEIAMCLRTVCISLKLYSRLVFLVYSSFLSELCIFLD